jgi:hypothetical protein
MAHIQRVFNDCHRTYDSSRVYHQLKREDLSVSIGVVKNHAYVGVENEAGYLSEKIMLARRSQEH